MAAHSDSCQGKEWKGLPPASLTVLVFEIEGHRYGLPTADVQELLRAVTVVPLPQAPAMIEGVINVRGHIVPVVDLRKRFHLPAKAAESTDHIILAWAGKQSVALRVDRATDLLEFSERDVEEASGVVPGAEYIAWIAKLSDDLVLIYDLRTFLSREESAALEDALVASGDTTPQG